MSANRSNRRKVLFVGPSLARVEYDASGIEVHGPAANGDLAKAALDGAAVIGLVDGVFGSTAATWHKEILFALNAGRRVLGASSMGALRAAECAPFGMEPVGEVARRYVSGDLDDDAAVALTHCPAEMGWLPMTEPLIEAEGTFRRLAANDLIDTAELRALVTSANSLFFVDRTVDAMVAVLPVERRDTIHTLYRAHRDNIKQRDALELVSMMRSIEGGPPEPREWALATPPMWRKRLASIRESG